MEDFDDEYEPDSRKRRKHSNVNTSLLDINSLPSIETLKPDELKNFTREELLTYLHSQGVGVNTNESKPALKALLRQVLTELEKKRTGEIPDGHPTPLIIDESLLSKNCLDCGSKKANKECQHLRCKGCCNKAGYQCAVHRDGKDGLKTPMNGFDSSPHSPTMAGSRTPSTPATTPMGKQATGSIIFVPPGATFKGKGGTGPSPNGPKIVANIPQKGTIQGPQIIRGPLFVQKEVQMAECPSCKQSIPYIGSNFYLHLNKCDPDFLTTKAPHIQIIRSEENVHEKVRLKALEKYKENIMFMKDLFDKSTSLHDLMDSIKSEPYWDEADLTNRVEAFQREIGEVLKTNKEKKTTWTDRSTEYFTHLKKLKTCTSLTELEECKLDFEKRFPPLKEEKPLIHQNTTEENSDKPVQLLSL